LTITIILQTYIQRNIEIWQPYTGAVDMGIWTRKHPLKDVIHCGSHMRAATGAQQLWCESATIVCCGLKRLIWNWSSGASMNLHNLKMISIFALPKISRCCKDKSILAKRWVHIVEKFYKINPTDESIL